jgi:hypothetical protein
VTYIVKTRGAGGLLVAEYNCPEHGVFEATVTRDANGDAPDTFPCPAEDDYDDGYAPDGPCSYPATWCISAPSMRIWSVPCFAATRGGDMTDRPPGMLDTRPLSEGMSMTEWKKKQRDAQRTRRHKMLVDKGLIQKKVIVG